MIFLYGYAAIAVILAMWLGFNMYCKLDRFDWHFMRADIWRSFWLTLIFWPFILVLNPSKLLRPAFKYDQFWVEQADRARQRFGFMDNPPPCGSVVTYRTVASESESTRAVFYFNSGKVHAIAEHMIKEQTSLEGMRGAARWTSLRNESVHTPTEVPDLLVNFDNIAEELVEAGHGQAICVVCNKTYTTSELRREGEFIGSWLWMHYLCPSQHVLLSREIAHFMRKRNDD